MAEIERKQIKDILVPWAQVNFVEKHFSIEDVTQSVLNSGHTRLPVVDNHQVVGVLHTKEFIVLKESGEQNWLNIIRPPLNVLPLDSAFRIMRLLQEKHIHMAIVLNPEIKPIGIVTLEDILEEIVGDIYDEDDDGRIRKVYVSKVKKLLPS